jgi:beta-glucosidase
MVLRIMAPYFHLQQYADFPPVDGFVPAPSFGPSPAFSHNFTLGPIVDVRREDHARLIRTLGAEGTVLLKNAANTLPLERPMNIGVFGNNAADLSHGLYSLKISSDGRFLGDYDIGTLPVGGGSGTGRFASIVSPLDAVKSRAQSYGALVQYITDNNEIIGGGLLSLAPVPMDVCLVFLKTWASEADDRTTLLAGWNSTSTVESVAAMCPRTVVVLHGGAPNILPWADHPNVTAILAAHFPGQETGNSIVDILWGDVNPSGRLPYTIAETEVDYDRNLVKCTALHLTNPNAYNADFKEGNDLDYKRFDQQKLEGRDDNVKYPFGFGLSYTTFELSALKTHVLVANVPRIPDKNAQILPGGNVDLWKCLATISVTVSNTGDVAGSAVPQLYLSFPQEAAAPVRSLRGFDKVYMLANESKEIELPLMRRDLSYWSTSAQAWTLPKGSIRVNVGFSSRDLPLEASLKV